MTAHSCQTTYIWADWPAHSGCREGIFFCRACSVLKSGDGQTTGGSAPFAAERRRMAGNEVFKAGDAKGAVAKYQMALSFLDEDFMMQLEGPHFDKVLPSQD